ncbi:MAG TPA: TonB-dependent receptor [Daejeonella sp.]|nr:TonB-dependent receptor [Daejeonella sp.]
MAKVKSQLIFKQLAIMLLSVFFNAAAFAQTGKISGTVTDKKTGETLIGVSIRIAGTTKGTSTDVEGRYILSGLSKGKYALEFSYLGFDTKKITDIEVADSKVSTIHVTLEESGGQHLNEVVITATARQESLSNLYAKQKNNASITDGISGDQIKRSSDKNTGDALKRVSGASIQDNKFVVIRGLGDRYNSAMMNNTSLPSTEPDKKAFSFDVIPSNLVDNIVVYKTSSPDLPGDFAGGAVKVNTKDLPEQQFVDFSASLGYNSKSTFKNNFIQPGSSPLDFLGFDNGSRSLPQAYAGYKNKNYTGLSYAEKLTITQQFPNTFGYDENKATLPNVSFQASTGNSKIFNNGSKLGYVAALNYGTARRQETAYRADFDINRNQLFSFDRNSFASTKNLGGVLNLAYLFGKNKLALKNFYNNDFTNDFIQRANGLNVESGSLSFQGFSNEITQNGLLNSVLEGQHSLGKRNIILDWNTSYGFSYRKQPDQRIVTLFNQNPSDPFYISLSNENSPKPNDLGRVYSKLTEDIYGASANLTIPFKMGEFSQKFKVGALKNFRSRDFSVDALGYVDGVGYGKRIEVANGTSLQNIFDPANLQQNQIVLARLDLSSTDYTGTSDLNAGYLMLDNKIMEKLRLVWGARLESYQQILSARGKGSREYQNTDILPSANLTYSLSAKTNVRAAFSRSLNRPEFRELADYRFYDYENNYNVTGNPLLVRSTNDNLDLRFEYYPSSSEILSISTFYKKFKNPIEQTNQGNSILSYQNAKSAKDLGVELELRKKLDFIGKDPFFENLTIYLNAAYIKADVALSNRTVSTPLQGQSPYLINGGLSYATSNSDMTFNLLYNRTAHRLKYRGEAGGIDIYEDARDVLDFQISKKVLKNKAELKLAFSDILAQPFSYYYKYDASKGTAYNPNQDRVIQKWNKGFNTSLSFRYNLGLGK